jgi:hypothetical protein
LRKEKSVEATCKAKYKMENIETTTIKVTVHIPDNVQRRQDKINRIYDILSPSKLNRAV